MDAPSSEEVQNRLLAWFDGAKRDMPWRRTRDPYRILLAEYLLQRTRIVSGTPYYERFVERFPDVGSLAAASEEEVLRAWEGLGFYRRARNLHRAAREMVASHGGRIPRTAAVLETLPGIGPYTAGAVASIAFGERVPAVDGNVTRVLARLFRLQGDPSRGPGREKLRSVAASLVPPVRPGDFNQALMELGSTVCTPTSPRCGVCPLGHLCLAHATRMEEQLPQRTQARKVVTVPVAFALVQQEGRTLFVRRPPEGLLGGLWSLPGGETSRGADPQEALRRAVREQTGLVVRIQDAVAKVSHTFSHRRWSGTILRCTPMRVAEPGGGARWMSTADLAEVPLVPFQRKALEGLVARAPLESFERRT